MALRLVEPLDRRASKPRRSPIRGRNRAPSGPERAFLALSDACESHRCFVPGPILQGFPGPEASRGGPVPGADCVFVGGPRTLGALAALILSARRCVGPERPGVGAPLISRGGRQGIGHQSDFPQGLLTTAQPVGYRKRVPGWICDSRCLGEPQVVTGLGRKPKRFRQTGFCRIIVRRHADVGR